MNKPKCCRCDNPKAAKYTCTISDRTVDPYIQCDKCYVKELFEKTEAYDELMNRLAERFVSEISKSLLNLLK